MRPKIRPKLLSLRILFGLCGAMGLAVSGPARAAGPLPPVVIVPDTPEAVRQAQIAIQQAQAEARRAAAQAQVQAELNANQARLQAQLAAQRARTQAQLAAARAGTATATSSAGELAALSLFAARPPQEVLDNANGTMKLLTLTPQLGRYFGTDRGVLVARAPTHGVLKLQDGDVILSIGDRAPASSSQAIRILASYDPGETIDLVILRDHRKIHVSAVMPASPAGP